MTAYALRPARQQTVVPLSPVDATRNLIIVLAGACIVVQTVIEPSWVNFATALFAGASSILTALYVFRRAVMIPTPISGLIVFGLSFTLLFGPLVFQTLDWRPITFNLDAPVRSITIAAFASFVSCVAHAAYRGFAPFVVARDALATHIHARLMIFKTPSSLQLWMMGFIGLAAMWASGTSEAQQSIEYGNVGGKFLQGLTPFMIAPALIPFSSYLFRATKRYNPQWWLISGYFILVLAAAFARNSREAFAVFLFAIVLCLMLAIWSGRMQFDRRMVIAGVAALVLGIPAMGMLSNISTAMLITRSERAELSAIALLQRTIETASDSALIENHRQVSSVVTAGLNWNYIDNPFFERLTLLKFLDLNVKHAEGITSYNRDYARYVFSQRVIAILPTPVIEYLNLNVDKSALRFSGGDVYSFLASRSELGGYLTGSAIVDGMVIMDLMFWPFLFVFSALSFIVYDAFSRSAGGLGIFFSPAILFTLDRLFMFGLNGENLADMFSAILRVYPQTLILYAVLFTSTAFAATRLSRGGATRRHSSAKDAPR